MGQRAMAGTCLATLVKMAIPLCQQAEHRCPRTGPGKPPDFPDWMMAILIMVAILKRKKTKSAQYRFLAEHRRDLQAWLGMKRWPVRSTYFERYRRAHRLFRAAIQLQGEKAVAEGVADPEVATVDKSLMAARGPLWHKRNRQQNRIPQGLHGVDRESTWGYSQHDGWVQGYSFEVVVSATVGSTVFPLAATVDTASAKETQTFADKVDELPEKTDYVLADSGYDSNKLGEHIEYDEKGQRTGRRFLCPENRRRNRAMSPIGDAWRARSFSRVVKENVCMHVAARQSNRSTNGSQGSSNWITAFGIEASTTTAHRFWRPSSPTSFSCVTTNDVATKMAKLNGSWMDCELSDTFN